MGQGFLSKLPAVERLLAISVAIIGLLLPLIYLAGVANHYGRLASYGINSAAFPLTIQEAYQSAYYYSVIILMSPFVTIMNFINDLFSFFGIAWIVVIFIFVSFIAWLVFHFAKKITKKNWMRLQK